MKPKSKLAAGLFGILLGNFGVHNFYMGYYGKAVCQLLLTILGFWLFLPAVGVGIWALVEGIMILASNEYTDARGVPLVW